MTPTTQFIRQLGNYRHRLPVQALKTLRGQALAGDLKGAQAGLLKLAERYKPKRG